ncbi:acid protease [Phellopilus nigrolimitatus]|nr:acid protease [Phellopilus nigrolimitatus]
MLDTGSSDLWVTGSVPNSQDSKKSVTLEYAVGQAAGDIYYADLTFGNFTVSDQAFLMVQNTSSFSTNITAQGYNGLIGLGPNTGSLIREKLDRDDFMDDAVLDRIFQANKTSQNYISFMIDRANDPGETLKGQFTISELAPGYESIASQPKLDVVTVPGLTDRDQHWQMYSDVDGVIGPDGQPIVYKSIVPKAPTGQLVAVIDSGFTLPQVPRSVSDAIYGRVQGAAWNANNQVWTIPCTQMLNISFKFGGVEYPIHPLDTSSSDFGLTDSSGNAVCVGTFQPITSAFSLLGEYDLILGMAFLRNTYTLIDLGNFVEGSSKDAQNPFVQMLSVTDLTNAHADFVKVRMNGVDTTGAASQQLVPVAQGQHSPESSEEKKAHLAEKVLSRWPYILFGSLVLFFGLVGLCVWRCCCRKRIAARKAAKKGHGKDGAGGAMKRLSVSALQMGPMKTASSYHPIEEPAPLSSSSSHPPSYHSEFHHV